MGGWGALSRPVNALLPGGKGIAHVGDKAHKLAARLANVRDLDDLYLSLVTEWQDPASVVRGGAGLPRGPSLRGAQRGNRAPVKAYKQHGESPCQGKPRPCS